MNNKDVIYIDIEDDITAIIGKVKTAASKIVALVPPKRIGALQSAVNLKLLQKAADSADKRLVIITNEHSLIALAAGLKIPVARNLQSRPEIPQLEALELPDEETINGQELPVGDVAKSLSGPSQTPPSKADEISDQLEITNTATDSTPPATPTKASVTPPTKSKVTLPKQLDKKGKFSIPNFDKFRKRLFIFGGIGVLLIAFLVWAFGFAPHATITISAKTTAVNADKTLSLQPGVASSDPGSLTLKPVVQQLKKSVATQFNATGTKDIGNAANGTVSLSNSNSSNPVTVPAGTTFTGADGHVFASSAAVTVPGATVVNGHIQPGSASVAVKAAAVGPDYNVAAQSYTIAGYDSIAASGSAMSGGTKQTVTVVSQDDVNKAQQQLAAQDLNSIKSQLKQQFSSDQIVIEESFSSDQSSPSVVPGVGEQAQTAKLTVETSYTYVGLNRTDVRAVLGNIVNDALKNQPGQQQYSLGDNSIVFSNFQKDGSNFDVRMVTTAQIGPKIDTKQLAKQLVGKRFGEIQALINQIPGVNNVDIQLSPFWVTTAPAENKIDIKFSIIPS